MGGVFKTFEGYPAGGGQKPTSGYASALPPERLNAGHMLSARPARIRTADVGPNIGDMSARIARHRGAGQVIGVDLVPERLAQARLHGAVTLNLRDHENDLTETIREMTGGRGPDAVIARPMGACAPNDSSLSSAMVAGISGVHTGPGATELTRIPRTRRS